MVAPQRPQVVGADVARVGRVERRIVVGAGANVEGAEQRARQAGRARDLHVGDLRGDAVGQADEIVALRGDFGRRRFLVRSVIVGCDDWILRHAIRYGEAAVGVAEYRVDRPRVSRLGAARRRVGIIRVVVHRVQTEPHG